MDRRQIASLLVLKELGIECAPTTFDNRLLIQKAIYLVQEAGLDLGYYYGWYLRGPYCSPVAQDIYSAQDDPKGIEDAHSRWALDRQTKDKLASIRRLFTSPSKKTQPNLARRLELLASVQYLIVRRQVAKHAPKDITSRLKKFNKNFSESEVTQALQDLRKAHLLPRNK